MDIYRPITEATMRLKGFRGEQAQQAFGYFCFLLWINRLATDQSMVLDPFGSITRTTNGALEAAVKMPFLWDALRERGTTVDPDKEARLIGIEPPSPEAKSSFSYGVLLTARAMSDSYLKALGSLNSDVDVQFGELIADSRVSEVMNAGRTWLTNVAGSYVSERLLPRPGD